jgi:hypothetical protein
MRGELIDLDAGEAVPAKARLEGLLEEVSGVADELGLSGYLDVLTEPTAAERYAEELEAGAGVEEVWPNAVERTRASVREWLSVREEERTG